MRYSCGHNGTVNLHPPDLNQTVKPRRCPRFSASFSAPPTAPSAPPGGRSSRRAWGLLFGKEGDVFKQNQQTGVDGVRSSTCQPAVLLHEEEGLALQRPPVAATTHTSARAGEEERCYWSHRPSSLLLTLWLQLQRRHALPRPGAPAPPPPLSCCH